MSDIICVTNRKLCVGDFADRIKLIAKCNPEAIILREKDMDEAEYEMLAEKIMKICVSENTVCILHNFYKTAEKLGCRAIHMPLRTFREMPAAHRSKFDIIGVSCHSVAEAKEAESLGCTYITAGHVFDTDCKKGIAGRGLEFLKNVCECTAVPVYAIGGIDSKNIDEVRKSGAAGACVMSGAMTCENIAVYFSSLENCVREGLEHGKN